MSALLKDLEKKGLVERIQSADNKKHIEINLLSKAEPIVEAGLKAQRQFAKNVLSGLSEEEKTVCISVFQKICNNANEFLKKEKEREVLFSKTNPKVGILMIPKACALYVDYCDGTSAFIILRGKKHQPFFVWLMLSFSNY